MVNDHSRSKSDTILECQTGTPLLDLTGTIYRKLWVQTPWWRAWRAGGEVKLHLISPNLTGRGGGGVVALSEN